MPKFDVVRSTEIDASANEVFSKLNDLSQWTVWSPWLIMEEGVSVTVSDNKKHHSWEGKRVGSGEMHISAEEKNQSIDLDLTFLKPWKSKSKVRFELEEKGGKTEVKWYMQGNLPFFMFWMKKMMITFISMDYDRGLRLLKDFVEDGEVHSKLNFIGNETSAEIHYIGIKRLCHFDDMGQRMREDMPALFAYVKDNELEARGPAFTQYLKWNFNARQVLYISGIPVKETPSGDLGEFISGIIPQTQVYTLEHVGPYPHLGNAWSTLYSMQRGNELNVNKKIHPFETYRNSPTEVGENDLITRIHFPVNGYALSK